MLKKVIFIASTSFSGSTMLDLILSNSEKGFSAGELAFFFNPEQKQHVAPRCGCGDPTCNLWWRLKSRSSSSIYDGICELLPGVEYVVDSSKDPFWIATQAEKLRKRGIDVAIVLIWKTPLEIAASFSRRNNEAAWKRHWLNYHRLLFTLVKNPIFTIRYEELVKEEEKLSELCNILNIDFDASMSRYWEKTHHTLFGNRSARRHLNEVEAGLQGGIFTDGSELKRLYYRDVDDHALTSRVKSSIENDVLLNELQRNLSAVNDLQINPETFSSEFRFGIISIAVRRFRRGSAKFLSLWWRLRVLLKLPVNESAKMRVPCDVAMVLPGHISGVLGGAEQQAHLIATLLFQRNDSVKLNYLCRKSNIGYEDYRYKIAVAPYFPLISKYAYWVDVFFLCNTLRKCRPKIIYTRDAGAYTGISAFMAKWLRAKLVLHLAHDKDLDAPHLMRKNFLQIPDELLRVYGLKTANYVVAQTHHQKDVLLSRYGREADLLLPNAHPLPDTNCEVKSSSPLVIWVANSTKVKRPELFVKLAKFYETSDVTFVMVGRTFTHDREWIESLKSAPNLEHLGPLPATEVQSLMERAWVMVSTSSAEGFPNTFIQSWMRATPVLSLTVDPDGSLEAGISGCVSKSIEQMKSHLDDLLASPSLRKRLGSQARRHATENFSISALDPLLKLIGSESR